MTRASAAAMSGQASAGMPMFPDDELEAYVRDAAGFPELEDEDASAAVQQGRLPTAALIKMLTGALAKRLLENRKGNGNGQSKT